MSAFNSSAIDLVLQTKGIHYVLCCGVSTNSCVEGTARDAAEHGYYTAIVQHGSGAATQALHDATVQNFKRLLGRLITCAEVIAELRLS